MSVPEAVRAGAWLGGLSCAAVIVREDRRSRRVPNAALGAMAALVLGGWATLALHTALSSGVGLPWLWHRGLAAHAAAAAAAGLGLWRAGVWPAGDAKLFILLAWLLPLAEPSLSVGGVRLAVALLMNVFLPAAAVFLAAGLAWLWHSRLRHDAGFLRQLGWEYVRDYARARQARLAADGTAALAGGWRSLRAEPGRAAAAVLDAAAMALAGASALSLTGRGGGPWAALGFFLVWDVVGRLVGRRVLWLLSAAAVWAAARAGSPAALAAQAGQWLVFGAALGAGRAGAAALLGAEERLLPAAWLFGPLLGLAPLALSGGLGAWAWWGAAGGAAYWFVDAFLA
ncbi:hypothetical protein EPO15_09350, partial [bacterium]